ncbi:MAG: DUF4198 domain-containing protein [Thermodesulfobacteriota bacterium]
MKKTILLALALTLFSASALYAHDTWVAREGGDLVVKYGHGDKIDPYKPAYVKEAKAYDASGREMAVTIKPQDTRAVLAPAQAPALVTIVYNSGAWVKTPEGYKNVSKREAKDVLQSMKGETHNKNIWQWSDRFSKPLGGKMELVPLKNPLSLKVGDTLPFQVIYNGKPLAGATVAAEGVEKDTLKTDLNGKAQIVIKKSGFNVVKANRKTPTPNDPDADTLSETANIAFEVK